MEKLACASLSLAIMSAALSITLVTYLVVQTRDNKQVAGGYRLSTRTVKPVTRQAHVYLFPVNVDKFLRHNVHFEAVFVVTHNAQVAKIAVLRGMKVWFVKRATWNTLLYWKWVKAVHVLRNHYDVIVTHNHVNVKNGSNLLIPSLPRGEWRDHVVTSAHPAYWPLLRVVDTSTVVHNANDSVVQRLCLSLYNLMLNFHLHNDSFVFDFVFSPTSPHKPMLINNATSGV